MIGPVHLGVAVHTALSEQEARRRTCRETISILWNTGMPGLRVAALAKQRGAFGQHARVTRSMRFVAQPAILADGCVLPEEWTTFVGVTLLAGIVDVFAGQLSRDRVAVHAVASDTVHLALHDRMGERFARLGALYLVAVEADVGLSRCLQNRIPGNVALMTIGTGDLVARMRPTVPAKADVALVAIQAHAVLFVDRCGGAGATQYDGRPFLSAPDATGVRAARPVTGLTLQLAVTKWPPGVSRYGMLASEYGERHIVLVAGEAGIRALARVVGLLTLCGWRSQQQESGKRYSL